MFQLFFKAEHDQITHVWSKGQEVAINVNYITRIEPWTVGATLLIFDSGDIFHVFGSFKETIDKLPMLIKTSDLAVKRFPGSVQVTRRQ